MKANDFFSVAPATIHNVNVAARMCAVIASTPGFALDYGWESINGVDQGIANIAFAAHDAAHGDYMTSCRWADAESLLRSGWNP